MAKTIMISNNIYEELKTRKRDRSFSELLQTLLDTSKVKKGAGLRACLGILKKDKEFEALEKTLEGGWKAWSKKYA